MHLEDGGHRRSNLRTKVYVRGQNNMKSDLLEGMRRKSKGISTVHLRKFW